MKNFIYVTLIFLYVLGSIGCKRKSEGEKIVNFDTIDKQNSNEIVKTNPKTVDYSGVYEGKINVNSGSTGYELVNGWLAFDFTGKNNIVLYDGVFLNDCNLVNDSVKGLGKFSENNKQKGFYMNYEGDDFAAEYIKPIFLRKTRNVNAAREKIKIYRDEKILFENFYLNFKDALLSNDFKKLASYGNFPLMDYSSNSKILNSNQLENKLRMSFDESF